jgi:protein TonB
MAWLDIDHRRMGAALLASGVLHAVAVALPAAPFAAPNPALPPAPRLQVQLLAAAVRPPDSSRPQPRLPPPDTPTTSGALLVPGVQTLEEKTAPGAPANSQQADRPPLFTLPDVAYHGWKDLSRRPQALQDIPLEPGQLKIRRESGKLVLKLWISEQGAVDRVEVERSELPPDYAAVVSKEFLSARFQPGEIDGKPVKALMRVEVDYVPLMIDPAAIPAATTPLAEGSSQSQPPPRSIAPASRPAPASVPPRR